MSPKGKFDALHGGGFGGSFGLGGFGGAGYGIGGYGAGVGAGVGGYGAGVGGYGAGGYGGHAGYGAGALGVGAVGAGYGAGVASLGHVGLGPVGIGPHSVGFAHPGAILEKGGGYRNSNDEVKGDGVIAVENLQPGVVRVIRLDKLDGFKDLKNLAGRGVIVCTKAEVGYGGKAQCIGEILSCCALAYDHQDRSLEKVGYY